MNKKRKKKSARQKKYVAEAQKKLYRTILFLVGLVLLVVFLFGDHGLYQLLKIKQQRKATQKRIVELQAEKAVLDEEKTRLETDMDYLERLAREKYRMAKKGEKVFKVIPREDK